ncbi:TonB-dependent copper receptor [Litoribacillus peritrichatus]|uniref:TonB-dependent receptor n=1 Tax=Litoribacillus peritrichatus TaxID=718191 RepID=A0ABP7N264_9GAMM
MSYKLEASKLMSFISNRMVVRRPFLFAVPMLAASVVAQADHSMAIDVIGEAQEVATETTLSTEQSAITRPMNDSGELLRSINGMTATRRGGHGFEPIIRGQQQSQLNILSDGGYIVSACPGRMDPATSYIGMETFDKVTVIKGNRSVIYGSGGSGGTILFERQRPEFEDGKPYQGTVTLGHTDNSEATSGSVDLSAGSDRGFVRVYAEKTDSGNYDDGDGNTVSSAYESLTQGVMLGFDVTDIDYIQLGYEQSRQDDIHYAGNGMDSPYADADNVRGKWVHEAPIGVIDAFELNFYRTDVEHLMDNYSVRDRVGMMGQMKSPASSESWGGRFLAKTYGEASELRYGVDYRASDQEVTRYMDMMGNGFTASSILWPDVELRNTGLFAEFDYQLNAQDMLRAGVRVDHWTAEATSADDTYGMMPPKSPNGLYETYYGSEADKRSENELGFVFGWDRDMANNMTFSANLSRTARIPDANELYIASDKEMRMMGMTRQDDWVGNPDLDAEIHHQLDLSLQQAAKSYSWSATAFYDYVEDYIERYQAGTGNDSVLKYRNVTATLAGFELEGQYAFTERVITRATLAYTRGMNTDDDTDLAQIAPLEAHFYADYKTQQWGTGLEWVVAKGQDRVDDDSGFDAGESNGFGVLHLKAFYQVAEPVKIEAGVENVFDKTYAYHVNSANADPFNPLAVRVNEPGRQLWVKGVYKF